MQTYVFLQGHKGTITGLSAAKLSDGRWLLISTSGDGDVVVSESNSPLGKANEISDFHEIQRISVGFEMQNAVAVMHFSAEGW